MNVWSDYIVMEVIISKTQPLNALLGVVVWDSAGWPMEVKVRCDALVGVVVCDSVVWPVEVKVCWERKWVDIWEEEEGDEVENLGEVVEDERDGGLGVVWELSVMLERLSVINVVEEVLKAKEMDGVDV